MEFPALVYRDGGPHQRPGGTFDYRPVNDEQQLQAALAEGWHRSVPEALAKKEAADVGNAAAGGVRVGQIVEDALGELMTSRQALEAQAEQLGIRFDGRTTDRKLAEAIAKAKG